MPDGERHTPTATVVPVGSAARAERARAAWSLRGHALFLIALALGATVRLVAVLGYRPALWFNDSFEYVGVALRLQPDATRPSGYSLLLRALEPLHSFQLVAVLQHLMGLAVGVMVYALLRRFGLPGWGATLAALPVLLDGYQIELEHMVLSDTLFTLLLTGAMVVALWHRRPSPVAGAVVGLLLAMSALTRSVGLPFIVLALGYLVARRVGWRTVVAAGVAWIVPLALYGTWFYAAHGRFALSNSGGVFLYARTTSFVDCARLRPPPDEARLCPHEPVGKRHPPDWYVWSDHAPLQHLPGAKFGAEKNALAGDFAKRAILAQPAGYLKWVWIDVRRSFQWGRAVYPNEKAFNGYRFRDTAWKIPHSRVFVSGGAAYDDLRRYENGPPDTRIIQPWADVAQAYQRHVYLPGLILGGLLAVGVLGLACCALPGAGDDRRRWALPLLLTEATALAVLVIPAATVEFGYRYVLPALPFVGLSVVLSVRLAAARLAAPRRSVPAADSSTRRTS